MPTYKNIRVPVGKSGKTRLQRVQVLASGKHKFVKNIKKTTSKGRKIVRSTSRNVKKVSSGSKLLRTYSATGALEDVAWGFIGFSILGKSPAALPLTRVIQGVQGHLFERRGKSRLVSGILDIISIYLAGGMGRNGVSYTGNGGDPLQELAQMVRLRAF